MGLVPGLVEMAGMVVPARTFSVFFTLGRACDVVNMGSPERGPVCLLALRVALEVGDGESRPPHSRGNWGKGQGHRSVARGLTPVFAGELGRGMGASEREGASLVLWVGRDVLFLGAVEPVDEFSHFLVQTVVPTSVGGDQDADEQYGQADLYHRALPVLLVGPVSLVDQYRSLAWARLHLLDHPIWTRLTQLPSLRRSLWAAS